MTSLAGLLAANLAIALLGAGVLLATGTWDRLRPASRIGPALLTGFAATAALLPPLIYAGFRPTTLVVGTLAALALALGVVLRRRRWRAEVDAGGRGLLAAAIVGVLLLPLALRAAVEPLVKFDAYADWSLKAKLLAGGLDPTTLGRLYGASHREYPLGLPAIEALDFDAMGRADAQMIHVQFVIVMAAFLATAWSLLRPRADPALLTAALCLLVVAPGLHTQVLAAYADVPEACLWVAAVLALARWLRDGRGDLLALSAVFAAGALAIKQEGLVLDGALLAVATAALLLAHERSRLGVLALAAGAVALSAMPWQIHTRIHDLHDADMAPSLGRTAGQLDELPEIVHQLGAQLIWLKWPAIVPVAAVAAIALIVWRRDRLAAGYLLLLVVAMGGLALVYLNARVSIPALLERSAERVVIAPLVLSAVALPVLLSRLIAPRSE
jgi:uncharacterized membrane protein YecN with MAPEG domain